MNRKAAQQLRDQRYQNAYGLLDLADDYKRFRQNNLDNNSRLLTGQMPMNESIQYVLDETVPGPDFGQVFGGLLGMTKKAGKVVDDLPMDEASRMARAKEMGFDTDTVYYHGTTDDFDEFSLDHFGKRGDPGLRGKGVYLTDSGSLSSGYADLPVFQGRYPDLTKVPEEELTRQVLPLHIKQNLNIYDANENPLRIYGSGSEYSDALMAKGYDGVKKTYSSRDNPSSEIVIFDPKNIRSIFAKFDPSKKDSANLLASGLLGAIGLGGLLGYQGDNYE